MLTARSWVIYVCCAGLAATILLAGLWVALANAPHSDRQGSEQQLGACDQADYVCADILSGFTDTLREALIDHEHIRLMSNGGRLDYALDAARLIIAQQANAEIDRYCASACVEVLLPAFQLVTLTDAPLIAVHGNPQMRLMLADREGFDARPCIGEYLLELEAVMGDRLVADNASRQADALGISEVSIWPPEGARCPDVTWTAEADYWALTWQELVDVFAVNAVGETAADERSVTQERIDCYFQAGVRVRVEQDILVSNGHSGIPGCNPLARR